MSSIDQLKLTDMKPNIELHVHHRERMRGRNSTLLAEIESNAGKTRSALISSPASNVNQHQPKKSDLETLLKKMLRCDWSPAMPCVRWAGLCSDHHDHGSVAPSRTSPAIDTYGEIRSRAGVNQVPRLLAAGRTGVKRAKSEPKD